MEIEFIFFHGQLRDLGDAATGEFGLIVLEKSVTGQLPGCYDPPGTAVLTAGLIPASCAP
jgi:hypothetical protein